MPLECPKCKSPVAREGQRFCYRCGHELNAYYDSLQIKVKDLLPAEANQDAAAHPEGEKAPPVAPRIPTSTVVLDANAFETKIDSPPASQKATIRILLPTGDTFDRELRDTETQIGKGPRNDIVIADPAVSTTHAIVHAESGSYTITDTGSRNGTFVNGERVTGPRKLNHGDVVAIGLSKLTFRLGDYTETGAIPLDQLPDVTKPAAPPPLTQDSLLAAIAKAGLATKTDIDRVLGDGSGRRLSAALVEERLVSEDALRDLIGQTFQISVVDLHSAKVDDAVAAEFPPKLAREHHVFAYAREADSLLLAVADPTDTVAVELIKREVRSPISLRVATYSQINEQVEQHYAPRLIGVLPSGEKLEYPIDKHEVEIGKASHNHIVLTDPTVSNTHAIVLSREGGYSIVDLGSRNGTFVNSERLGAQARTLRHGDRIQLGQTVLTFRNPGETTANVTAVLSGEAVEAVRKRAEASVIPPADASEQKPPAPSVAPPAPATSSPAQLDVVPAASEGAVVEDKETDQSDKKKKKKKKKKDKDERVRAAYVSALGRVFAAILSVALTVLLTIYLTRSSSSPSKEEVKISKKGHAKLKLPKATAGTQISGGKFEASGVVQVPGTDGVLFVDDAKLDEILWMQVDSSGNQTGEAKAIQLGASIGDMEGITYGDGYFYVTGSQSDPKDGDQNAIARFKFDAANLKVKDTEVATGFRDFLLANVPELKGEGEKNGKDGGLNIEGLAWDPNRNRLILGLRSPQVNGNALLVPVALVNPGGQFSVSNLKMAESRAIQLPLEGMGVRDIQYDSRLKEFLIISGAPEHHEKKLGFKLWQWNGSAAAVDSDSGIHSLADLDTQMKPEGITHFESGGNEFILIVGDAGSYIKLEYTESE